MWPAETLGLVLAGRKLSSRPVSAVVGLYSECTRTDGQTAPTHTACAR